MHRPSLSLAATALTVALALPAAPARAIPPCPDPFEARGPDGRPLTLYVRGTPDHHWLEDPAGRRFVEGPAGYREATPADLALGHPHRSHRDPPPALAARLAAGTTLENLVVLLRFKNHRTRRLPRKEDLDILFNQPGGHPTLAPTGSVTDLYKENSYGKLVLRSTLTGWIDLPKDEAYYAAGRSGMTRRLHEALRHALTAADARVDFRRFDKDRDGVIDAITFVHSGFGAEVGGKDQDGAKMADRIWSHKWQMATWRSKEGVRVRAYNINAGLWGRAGAAPVRLGLIAHELGHYLGLPDYYDQGSTPGAGIGSFGLMANPWGFDRSQRYPPYLSAYSKMKLGWLDPKDANRPGRYRLDPSARRPAVLKVSRGFPRGEFLLIENRQPVGYDALIPDGGLAVWHIDERVANNNRAGYPGQAGWPANGKHYRVALLQADGRYHLERPTGGNRGDGGDLYRPKAGDAIRLGPATTPDTHAYQGGKVKPTGLTLRRIRAASAAEAQALSFELGWGRESGPAGARPDPAGSR